MRTLALGTGLMAASVAAYAADVQITTAMDNFWMRHGPLANYNSSNLYGPSGSAAGADGTWAVSQWGTHPPLSAGCPTSRLCSELLPFGQIECEAGRTECYRAVGTEMVATRFKEGGIAGIKLQSTGINKPCPFGGVGGDPYELDTLINPNVQANSPGFPDGILNQPTLDPAAATPLTSLVYTVTFKVKSMAMYTQIDPAIGIAAGQPAFGYRCPPGGLPGTAGANASTNTVALTMATTFSNPTGGQTMFYQITIGRTGFIHANVGSGFFDTDQPVYGFFDSVDSYGFNSQMPALDTPITYILDILPRIRQIISFTNPVPGFPPVVPAQTDGLIDHDLSHWRVGGMYVGHVTYGRVGLVTEWNNIDYRGTTP